ncbi:MAG TPA: outer membrane beta-barrel protein, partial [Flavobacterium sp.]|uniref:outer membrane beta-barrel protein n=1 Tax=Flavobacterium sp. TaxID=239 RepID=UPI002CFB950C
EKFTSKTDFYFGGYGAIKLSKYYTLQPEIVYSRQGTYFEYMNEGKTKIDVSYLSFGVVNKFTFINKFNVHVGPTLDFQIEKNNDVDLSNNFDLALMLGAGYDFTDNFGVEARIKQGLIPMSDGGVSSETNVVYQLGINYTFDIK